MRQRYTIAIRLCLVLILASMSVGYVVGQTNRQVLTAQELRLTDSKGKIRAIVSIAEKDNTPSIRLLDDKEQAKLSFALDPSGNVVVQGISGIVPKVAQRGEDKTDVIATEIPHPIRFIKAKLQQGSSEDRSIGYGSCQIECEVKNITLKALGNIRIKANFYDSKGNYLDEDIAVHSILSSGDRWPFELRCTNNAAVSGKIVEIKVE